MQDTANMTNTTILKYKEIYAETKLRGMVCIQLIEKDNAVPWITKQNKLWEAESKLGHERSGKPIEERPFSRKEDFNHIWNDEVRSWKEG